MYISTEFLAFTGIYLLGLISPGPDFALVTRNSLVHSSAIGRWTAVGIALGILVHVTYCIVGLGAIFERSILAYSVMRLAGACYLIWIGVKALRSKPAATGQTVAAPEAPALTPTKALRMGFATNALNPKATVLFVSLFTQVLGPHTTFAMKVAYGSEMFLATLCYFLVMASVFGSVRHTKPVRWLFQYVERITGAILVAFGVKLALSRSH